MPADTHTLVRFLGLQDYTLPATVHGNITVQPTPGEPTHHSYARALLVEVCLALPATPIAVYQRCHPTTNNSGVQVFTLIVLDDHHEIITLGWRQGDTVDHTPDRSRGWQLSIDGQRVHHSHGREHPSPVTAADIIRRIHTN